MTSILQAVENGDLETIDTLLAGDTVPADLCVINNEGHNIFDIAIAKANVLVVLKLIKLLKNKKDQPLKDLLGAGIGHPCPILAAAALPDPQIFNALLKVPIGYSADALESIKGARRARLDSERKWGLLGALFKSACPSKALVDAVNIPSTLFGFTLTLGTALLSLISYAAFVVAMVGLVLITYSNYKKLKTEQNIGDSTLEKTILLAHINNLEVRLAQGQMPVDDIKSLLEKAAEIQPVDFHNKQSPRNFLIAKDKRRSVLTTLGEFFCTTLGFAGIVGLALTAPIAPAVILIPSIIAFVLIAVVYVYNHPQQNNELAEQRMAQAELENKLYKSFKNFKLNPRVHAVPGSLALLDFTKIPADKTAFTQAYQAATPAFKEAIFFHWVRAGHSRWVKFLMRQEEIAIPTQGDPSFGGKTLLHVAVERGHLKLAQELLGVSMAAKARQTKAAAKNPYVQATHAQQYNDFEALSQTRKGVLARYDALHNAVKPTLLQHVHGELPLQVAAKHDDPALYYLLLEQPVQYSQHDLHTAWQTRQAKINSGKSSIKTIASAVVESICPVNSPLEITSSFSLIGLVSAAIVVGPAFGAICGGLFLVIAGGNFYRKWVEKQLGLEFETLSKDLAYAAGIKRQLETPDAVQPVDKAALRQSVAEMVASHHPIDPKNLLTPQDKAAGLGVSFGALLCAYTGAIGVIELGMAAFGLAVTGPIGWGLVLAGALAMGLAFGGFYFYKTQYDLRSLAELRQTNYLKQQDVATVCNSGVMQGLQHPMQPLNVGGAQPPPPAPAPATTTNPTPPPPVAETKAPPPTGFKPKM